MNSRSIVHLTPATEVYLTQALDAFTQTVLALPRSLVEFTDGWFARTLPLSKSYDRTVVRDWLRARAMNGYLPGWSMFESMNGILGEVDPLTGECVRDPESSLLFLWDDSIP